MHFQRHLHWSILLLDFNQRLAKLILTVKSNENVLLVVKAVQDYDWSAVQWKVFYFHKSIYLKDDGWCWQD